MFKNMDYRIRITVGIIFIIGGLFGTIIGFDLKSIGEKYNHIWTLSLISIYAGVNWISKALN